MPRIKIPQNIGRVRVVMALGGKFAVWNGKEGWEHKFLITCRDKAQAREVVDIINGKKHNGEIEVTG